MEGKLGRASGEPIGVPLRQDEGVLRISIDNVGRVGALASDFSLCSGRGIRRSRRAVSSREEGSHRANDQRE